MTAPGPPWPEREGEGFAALDSASISDALDRLGIAGQPVGIRPLHGPWRICGPAFTVRYEPVDPDAPGTVGDFIDDVAPGAVVVIDNGGRLDATVWGDLMTTVAARNAVAGTVIDGVSRDTPRALELGYPIFARSTFMRTGKDRVQLAEAGGPVRIGDVAVEPGDIVFGDADGVVVVPRSKAAAVLEAARAIDTAEEEIRALLARGERLDAARQKLGYHGLQSKA
jgi:4-hydroxy-4-methyl-2-oxoglutarate aldolase